MRILKKIFSWIAFAISTFIIDNFINMLILSIVNELWNNDNLTRAICVFSDIALIIIEIWLVYYFKNHVSREQFIEEVYASFFAVILFIVYGFFDVTAINNLIITFCFNTIFINGRIKPQKLRKALLLKKKANETGIFFNEDYYNRQNDYFQNMITMFIYGWTLIPNILTNLLGKFIFQIPEDAKMSPIQKINLSIIFFALVSIIMFLCALFSQENRITTRLNKYRYLKIKASLSENPNSEYKVFKSYELLNSEEQLYMYDYDEYEYLIMDLNISQEDNDKLQKEFETLKKITHKSNKSQNLISKLKKEKS